MLIIDKSAVICSENIITNFSRRRQINGGSNRHRQRRRTTSMEIGGTKTHSESKTLAGADRDNI
jgi:hypothetical protein